MGGRARSEFRCSRRTGRGTSPGTEARMTTRTLALLALPLALVRPRGTVGILVAEPAAAPSAPGPLDLRVSIDAGGGCARTCAASCAARTSGLECAPGLLYVPFADEGFGEFVRRPGPPRSSYCGL